MRNWNSCARILIWFCNDVMQCVIGWGINITMTTWLKVCQNLLPLPDLHCLKLFVDGDLTTDSNSCCNDYMVNRWRKLLLQLQGSQHFKKTKFPDFFSDEVSKFHDNYFNSFPVSHVFYVVEVTYLQYKTL